MGDLLLRTLGNDLASAIAISFHILNGQEICKVTVSPSPREVVLKLKDKNGQPKQSFFIRAGNSTRSLDDLTEMLNYIRDRWAQWATPSLAGARSGRRDATSEVMR